MFERDASPPDRSRFDDYIQSFMKHAASFDSRQDFDQYMSQIDNGYLNNSTMKGQPLYKSPFDGRQLKVPSWPPKPTMSEQEYENDDVFYETASQMHDLRRGI
jgi:hypothetical protein